MANDQDFFQSLGANPGTSVAETLVAGTAPDATPVTKALIRAAVPGAADMATFVALVESDLALRTIPILASTSIRHETLLSG